MTVLGIAWALFGRFKIFWWLLILISVTGYVYYKGDQHGAARINARWTAAEKAMQDRGAKAREDAEVAIVSPPEPELEADEQKRPAIGKPCKVFDKFDRDCAQ